MRFRQVHLDFHTSEHIPEVGSKFDKKQFQDALRAGHVDSITIFAKCHHGWAYFNAEKNEIHPTLGGFELLDAQLEAAHEIGVKAPIYISAGTDERLARRHPEWLIRGENEAGWTSSPHDFDHPGFHRMCLNSPYLEVLLEQTREVCQKYYAKGIDGLFFDIVGVQPCRCSSCLKTLREEGRNPDDPAEIWALAERVHANYTRRIREVVDETDPTIHVFHNSGHITRGRRDLANMSSHYELESLPTGGWGYDHFPLSARYVQQFGVDYLGMTGKFHRSWGEFGGFKHPNALRYECALSVANGAKCSIGDQCHPSGRMEMATYKLIGAAYAEIEVKEPWLDGVDAVADIGVLSLESCIGRCPTADKTDAGVVRMLLEGNYLFNVLDKESDFSPYKVLILPDAIKTDAALLAKLQAYVAGGGKILASGCSGLNEAGDAFAFDLGAIWQGESSMSPNYLRPTDTYEPITMEDAAYAVFGKCYRVQAAPEARALAMVEPPYFNRTAEHFCSHQNTPNNLMPDTAAITVGTQGAYVAWEIFADYANIGMLINKKAVHLALDALLDGIKTVQTSLPAQGVVTLMNQAGESRYVCHLLYATPVRRGTGVEIIEDIVPLYNIALTLRTDKPIKRVYLAPTGEELPFVAENGSVTLTVPTIDCHQMVVFDY